ncbi:MAG TPA: hypothetical protein VF530_23135 [Planctomycetota bacterium]
MEHLDDPKPAPASPATDDKRPYEAPKVESVRLTQEAAESLT